MKKLSSTMDWYRFLVVCLSLLGLVMPDCSQGSTDSDTSGGLTDSEEGDVKKVLGGVVSSSSFTRIGGDPCSAEIPCEEPGSSVPREGSGSFPSVFYYINKEAYKTGEWYKKRDGKVFTPDDVNLHIFAFNVGQGNCIILRKKGEAVIIDAGRGDGNVEKVKEIILPKIKTVLDGSTLKTIFITHPHADHYNLIPDILEEMGSDKFVNTELFLGGGEDSWKGKNRKKARAVVEAIMHKITGKKKTPNYITTKTSEIPRNIEGVTFKIIFPEEAGSDSSSNSQSLIIKVTYKGRSILFTGDAVGEGVGRIIGHVEELAPLEELSRYLSSDIAEQFQISEALLKKKKKEKEKKRDPKQVSFKANRTELKDVSVVFLPHHGSSSENSQRWMGYFEDQKPTWFVSSTPEGRHGLPTRSIIERCSRTPEHTSHAFSYAGEGGTFNGEPLFQFTTKPLYITGAAPGGVYWLRVSKEKGEEVGKVEFYDAYPKRGWKNIME